MVVNLNHERVWFGSTRVYNFIDILKLYDHHVIVYYFIIIVLHALLHYFLM